MEEVLKTYVMENVRTKRIALIADVFQPVQSSGAVQLRDLSLEFVNQGHDVTT